MLAVHIRPSPPSGVLGTHPPNLHTLPSIMNSLHEEKTEASSCMLNQQCKTEETLDNPKLT